MLSPCLSRGRLFCRLAVLRRRLFELLFEPGRVGGGARPEFPQGMPIALALEEKSLMICPAFVEEADDAVGQLAEGRGVKPSMMRRRGPGATNMELAGRGSTGCWKFKVGRWKFTDRCAVRASAAPRLRSLLAI